jgi:hypothetical protein
MSKNIKLYVFRLLDLSEVPLMQLKLKVLNVKHLMIYCLVLLTPGRE